MNSDQYDYWKKKYLLTLDTLKHHKEGQQIYSHLQNFIKFNDFKKKIHYNGNHLELVKCYFPLTALTIPRKEK